MQFSFFSLFAYLGVLTVSFYFASLYEKYGKKSCLILTYLTLVCFCGFRFFVGNDYAGYVKHFSLISIYEENVIFIEPGCYSNGLLSGISMYFLLQQPFLISLFCGNCVMKEF